ncbi:hypothetical protein GGR53DRAFT_463684 [Hypoxylon sp. FL1150]|nr:hypothetical protein GGR53DRAFT_463684 [Hypoxylon sp. FL1150]
MTLFDDPAPPVVPSPNQWADNMSLEEQQGQKQHELDVADDLLFAVKHSVDEFNKKRRNVDEGAPPSEVDALYDNLRDLLRQCDEVEDALQVVGGLPPGMFDFKNEQDFQPLGIGPPLSHTPGLYRDMHQELSFMRDDLEGLQEKLQKVEGEEDEDFRRLEEEDQQRFAREAEDEANPTNSLFGDEQYEPITNETFDDLLETVPQGTKRSQDDDPDELQESKRAKLNGDSTPGALAVDPSIATDSKIAIAPVVHTPGLAAPKNSALDSASPSLFSGSGNFPEESNEGDYSSSASDDDSSVHLPETSDSDAASNSNKHTGGGLCVLASNSAIDSDSDDKSHFSEESSDSYESGTEEGNKPEPVTPVAAALETPGATSALRLVGSRTSTSSTPLRMCGGRTRKRWTYTDQRRIHSVQSGPLPAPTGLDPLQNDLAARLQAMIDVLRQTFP